MPNIFRTYWEKIKSILSRFFKGKQKPTEPTGPLIKRIPGLDCPRCGFRIQVSIPMLLSGNSVICTACGLKLTVDKEKSKGCLSELRKVNDAVRKAEEMKRGMG